MTAPLLPNHLGAAELDHQPLLLQRLVEAVGAHGQAVRTYTVCLDCTVVVGREVLAYVAWPCAPVKRLTSRGPRRPPCL